MKKIFLITASIALSAPLLNSCRDADLDPTLSQSKDLNSSINNVEDMKSVLNAGYNRMSNTTYYGRDFIIFGEVRSDNAFSNANSNRFVTVGQMKMQKTDAYAADTWTQIYATIATANIVINKDISTLTGDVNEIKQLQGEALAMRALAHFDLLKLFGQQHVQGGGMSALGVPYVKTFRDETAMLPARNTVQEVYDFAMADLDQALSLMKPSLDRDAHYLSTDAVNAIKSRIALYFKDYAKAEAAAAAVVNAGNFSIATASAYPSTFNTDLTGNQIFSIAVSETDNMGINGLANIYQKTSYGDVEALGDIYNQYEAGDVRKSMMSVTGSTYRNIGKYPSKDPYKDDIPVIRYEEVVLNYAEALLMNGKAAEALVWLNKIPANRGASLYTAATLDNILAERRKELAFEGFRFYDLARTGKNIPLVDPLKQTFGSTVVYGSYNYAFPIPNAEVGANSNIKQNYNY